MRFLRAAWFRLRALLDRSALDGELDAELRDHIERETRANVTRGMSEADAKRAALVAFGGVQQYKEATRETRSVRWLEVAWQDTSHSLRSLRKSPGLMATVMLTMALGVGANAAVFSVLNQIYLREPAGIGNAGEVRRLYERLPADAPMNGSHQLMEVPQFDYLTFAAMRPALKGRAELIAFSEPDSVAIGRGADAVPALVSYVSDNYFSALGVRSVRGRFFASSEGAVESDPGVAVIGYALWERAFDRDPGIVGRKIEVGKRPYVVIGVASKGFSGLDLDQAELFIPLGAFPGNPNNGRPWYTSGYASYFRMVARVPNGDDRPMIAVATLVNRRFNSDNRGQSPAGSHPDTLSTVVTGPIIYALGPGPKPKEYAIGVRLAGVSAIVLLIACANIANLLLVRAIRRRHEVAVRLALGVSRARLLLQFLTEGLVLAALGGTAAILVAAWGGTALRRTILPSTHWATPALDVKVLAFTISVALLAGIVAALLPALQGSRVDIVSLLKPGSRGREHRGSRVRSTLLASQTALSLVLLVGAGLFVRSLRNVHDLPIGYAADELAFASVYFDDFANHKAERNAAFPRAADRIASAPDVMGVALAAQAPLRGAAMSPLFLPGVDSLPPEGAFYNSVSPAFFEVAGMRLLAGRAFTVDDRRGPGGAVIVSETMARVYWPGESALGKCLILRKKTAGCSNVVGVVVDGRMMSILEPKTPPQYFLPLRAAVDSESVAPGAIIVRTRAGRWRAAGAIARSELRRLIPNSDVVVFKPMSAYLEPELQPWRLGATVFIAFGLLALLVATVGVYGVIAYSFSQRTHELGVRTALGASVADTYRLVLGEAARLTAVGVAAGIVLALALGRLIASLLYATSARDPVVIALAAAVLLGAGIAASLVPAWRASKADPMTALRAE